jgi:hypothetical protein
MGRAERPRPSLRDLRAAGRTLTDEGRTTFSASFIARTRELGGSWSPFTLRELLTREAAAEHGCMTRVRKGFYCLRAGADAPAESTDAAGAALTALRSLAADGRIVVTRRDVEAAIAAAGTPYSSRSVRAGLLALLQAERQRRVRHRVLPAAQGG